MSILKQIGQKFIRYPAIYKRKIYTQKKSITISLSPNPQNILLNIIHLSKSKEMDNRKELQQVVDYVNNLLSTYPSASDVIPINIDNCVDALHDGVILCYVVNCLSTTGQVIKESQLKKSKATLFHKMDQVNRALDAAKKIGLSLINIRAEFIVEKKENTIIGLFNQITRQRPGPKPDLKKQTSDQKTEKTPVVVEPPQTVPLKKQQSAHFVIQQQQPEIKHEKPIVHQEEVVLPVAVSNPKQDLSKLKINEHQVISNQAKNGYNFQNVQGIQLLVLVGSLRKGSTNHGIITCLEQIKTRKFFENIHFHVPDLSILPLFNEDLVTEGRLPKAIKDLREICKKSQGVLFATPEYNGSVSGIIKNVFDWLSQSYQNDPSPLNDKKIGIVSASYLTQNQIQDLIEMGHTNRCNYFSESFYVSLRTGAFNMESGALTNQYEMDRLALWYQDFSYFIISTQAKPEPTARFIMNL